MDINIALVLIIGVNVLISYKGFNDAAFFRKYDFHIGSIRAGQQYRMFTSAFLHADFVHLFLNMFVLFMFSGTVIGKLGIVAFLLVYFASLVCGSMLTLYFHKDDHWYRAIGASGAVTGVMYSALLFLPPDENLYLYGILPIPVSVFGIGYLLYSIYGMKAKNDNIGHVAHFGGAIGGYAITLSRVPDLIYDNTLMVILLAVPIVFLFVLSKMGKI